jgi:hypothetical protein
MFASDRLAREYDEQHRERIVQRGSFHDCLFRNRGSKGIGTTNRLSNEPGHGLMCNRAFKRRTSQS